MTIYDLPKREHLKEYPKIECRNSENRFDECHIYMDDLVKKVAENGLFSDVIKEQVNDKCFPLGVPEGFDQTSY